MYTVLMIITSIDGIAEEEQGIASGLLSTSFQFGAALGLSLVTAVNIAATTDASTQAMLDGFRIALIVPVAAVVIGVIITSFGLRKQSINTVNQAPSN